jgi:hypothetical protein
MYPATHFEDISCEVDLIFAVLNPQTLLQYTEFILSEISIQYLEDGIIFWDVTRCSLV